MELNKLKSAKNITGKIKEFFSDSELIEMANNALCPHYIVYNPLKKTNEVCFIQAELNSWMIDNLIKQRRFVLEQELNIQYVDYDIHKISETDIVPSELTRIKSLLKLPIALISTPPGVYFLCKEQNIVYIGKAKNVYARILNHIDEGIKKFDRVYFIPCHINNITPFETALLKCFKPPLNAVLVSPINDKEEAILNNLFGGQFQEVSTAIAP